MTVFDLQPSDLIGLGPDRAVDFFRKLLLLEAVRVHVNRNLINVPHCIDVADGGIDAVVKDALPLTDELIPKGTSGFQIKSSGLSINDCKKELYKKKDINGQLNDGIVDILKQHGNYVLVLFADITTVKRKKIEAAIKEEIERHGYNNPIRVYTIDQLISMGARYIPLIAWLKEDFNQCQSYSSWGRNRDVQSPHLFVFDDDRSKKMAEIRKLLRKPKDNCPVFRITGLSGIGKTRFVFETLSPDDLQNRVIYVDTADRFQASSLYMTLLNDQEKSAIIVIDECNLAQHEYFVRAFSGRGSRLAVFTLSYERGSVSSPTLLYIIEPLEKDKVKEIIKAEAPQLPENVAERLSEFADGYPRIAVLLCESYYGNRTSLEDYLMVSDQSLMHRLIWGSMDPSSEHAKKIKRALMGVSLFSKIGYMETVSIEAQWLAKRFNIDWDEFKEIIKDQKQRGIMQGQYYIYLTPFMLRIYLIQEWWETYGTVGYFTDFMESIPSEFRYDLFERFTEHIPYITATNLGRLFTKKILGRNGLFADGSNLKIDLNAKFFLKLTEADPISALDCLKRTIGNWSKEELLHFTTGRREIVWSLERIAIWKTFFADAANLLLALGEAENETCSNNASGVFAELFSLGRGQVASTEASPQERLPTLRSAIVSQSTERRKIALFACDCALETGHFIRLMGAEYQGLRREPKLWMPSTYGELFDAYRQVWQILYAELGALQDDNRDEAINILLRRAVELAKFANLECMIRETLSELAQLDYKDRILATVVKILHYSCEHLSRQAVNSWKELRDELTGSDFSSLMRRYVGMSLLEDEFDEDCAHRGLVQRQVETLAQQAITNNDLLFNEIDWLVLDKAVNGYQFGYELGKIDRDFQLLPQLMEAQHNACKEEHPDVRFVSGYLRVVFEKDKNKWEHHLNSLVADKDLNAFIPELTCCSGMSDMAALRVIDLIESGISDVKNLRMFCYGNVIRGISRTVFRKLIDTLLDKSDMEAVSIALDLYAVYYIRKEAKYKLPKQLTFKLLTHRTLFSKNPKSNLINDFHWSEIGKDFLHLYPEKSLEIANQILKHFGEEGTIVGGHHSRGHKLLNQITKQYPHQIWKSIVKYLGPPSDIRAYRLKEWLRGAMFDLVSDQGEMLSSIPQTEIWQWVDEHVEQRASYLASFVPKTFFRADGRVCLARELLVRYGDRDDVRKRLFANFSTDGWCGPESIHYQNKKNQLLDFREGENNKQVIRWIDDYISSLDARIERSKIYEEREGIVND